MADQQYNAGQFELCERCGSVKVNGSCPNCGTGKRGMPTGAKVAVALASVLAVSAVFGAALFLGNRSAAQDRAGNDPPVEAVNPPSGPQIQGADEGFYWPEWSGYVQSYDDAPEADYGTIRDARSGASYAVVDYYFEYDGQQEYELSNNRKYYSYPSTTGMDVSYSAHYIQLEGAIPHLDEINEQLRYWPLSGPAMFIEWSQSDYDDLYGKVTDTMISQTRSFVTYNSEDFLSVAVVEHDEVDNIAMNYIVSVNIDLKNGEVLELCDMARLDDGFMDEFLALGNEQFPDNVAFQTFTREEHLSRLDGTVTYAAAFLQPDMVQIGYNYTTETTRGWLTVEYPADRIPEDLLKYYADPPAGE